MYLLFTSRKLGGGPSKEAPGTLSISQLDHHNITPLSSTITLCVGRKSLGTAHRIGGTSIDLQDRTISVTSLKMKYEPQDR